MTTDQIISIADVLVSAAGPLAVVVVAFLANKRFKQFENTLEDRRRVSDTRFGLYKDLGFKLNDLYAYFLLVGNWKEHTPKQMIEHKRYVDRFVFTYRPLFSDEFNQRYDRFILDCFATFGGWGRDARLRTTSKHRAEHGNPEWADCFTEENNRAAIRESYAELLKCLAADLGLNQPERNK